MAALQIIISMAMIMRWSSWGWAGGAVTVLRSDCWPTAPGSAAVDGAEDVYDALDGLGALMVCRVAITRCPVSAAVTAVLMVSVAHLPIMITSGS